MNNRYVVSAGPLDTPDRRTTDVLFLSTVVDYLWQGQANRAFSSSPIG